MHCTSVLYLFVSAGKNNTAMQFPFLGHLLRDDLINPVKMSIRGSVHTSTMKHNADTNQIVVFVKVDETFMTILLSRSSEVRVKVRR